MISRPELVSDCHDEDMRQFFGAYADALQSRDPRCVMRFLDVPIIIRRAHATQFIRDREELQSYQTELFDQYDRAGMARLEHRFIRGRKHGATSASVALVWTLIDTEGARTELAEVGYTLECIEEAWRIVAIDLALRDHRTKELDW